MSEKLSKEETGAIIVGHLTQYSQRVAEVVDDYRKMQKEREMPNEGKVAFGDACMKDVAILTDILVEFLNQTMAESGAEVAPSTQTSEADIIDLQQYKTNGGLLN